MATSVKHPLTDEHCECLDKVLQAVPEALELVRTCKDCGLDVAKIEQTLNAQLRMAQRLKAQLFPDRP